MPRLASCILVSGRFRLYILYITTVVLPRDMLNYCWGWFNSTFRLESAILRVCKDVAVVDNYSHRFSIVALPGHGQKIAIPNPWPSLKLLFRLLVGLVLLANGVIFGSYYAVTAGMPAQFAKLYHLNSLQVGLCYIPAGLGSLLSATLNGFLIDWNYRRICTQAGLALDED
jgi:hypothetical protein